MAHPELCRPSNEVLYFRPDDRIPGYEYTWRQGLVSYNRLGKNPYGLSRAAGLYKAATYRELADACGWANTFLRQRLFSLLRHTLRGSFPMWR